MQQIFEEVAMRLTSKNPDSDLLIDLMKELVMVNDHLVQEDWKGALVNVANVYNLEIPECLK